MMWNIIEHIRGATPGRRLKTNKPSSILQFAVSTLAILLWVIILVFAMAAMGDPA